MGSVSRIAAAALAAAVLAAAASREPATHVGDITVVADASWVSSAAAPPRAVRNVIDSVAFLPDRDEGAEGVRFVARSLTSPISISAVETALAQCTAVGVASGGGSRWSPRVVPAAPGTETTYTSQVLRMRVVGGNASAAMRGESALARRSNLYLGDNPSGWRENVPNYARVRTVGVYPGIDLVHHAAGRTLEFDFEIAPGADPSQIALSFSADGEAAPPTVTQADGGALIVAMGDGSVRVELPAIYQDTADGRRAVDGHFVVRRGADGGNEVAFAVADYDRTRALVIDPTLVSSRYIGGPGTDTARDLRVSPMGRTYLYGETNDLSFLPNTVAAGGATLGNVDAYIVEVDESGQVLRDAVFGGTEAELATRLAIGSTGVVTAVGTSSSGNFPQTNGTYAGTVSGTQDRQRRVYAIAFTPDLTLSAATRLRAGATEVAFCVTPCPNDDIVIGEISSSATFPITVGAAYPTRPPSAFGTGGALLRLDAGLTTVVAATFLPCTPYDVDAFAGGDVVVCGGTSDSAAPTVAAAQPTFAGGNDGFVVRLNGALTTVRYATFFGGTGQDVLFGGVTLDPPHASGADYFVTGIIASPGNTTIPLTGEALHGANDMPLVAFNTGGAVVSHANLGGTGFEVGANIGVYEDGGAAKGVYVVGYTDSFADYEALPGFAAGGGVGDICIDIRPFASGGDPLPPTGAERFRYGSTGGDVPSGTDVIAPGTSPTAKPFRMGGRRSRGRIAESSEGGLVTTGGAGNQGADDNAVVGFNFVRVCVSPQTPRNLTGYRAGDIESPDRPNLVLSWDQPPGGDGVITFRLFVHEVDSAGNVSDVVKLLESQGPGEHDEVVTGLSASGTTAEYRLTAYNDCPIESIPSAYLGTSLLSPRDKAKLLVDPATGSILIQLPDVPVDGTIAVSGTLKGAGQSGAALTSSLPVEVVDVYASSKLPKSGRPKPNILTFGGRVVFPAHATSVLLPFRTTELTAPVKVVLKVGFNGRTKTVKLKLRPPKA